MGVPVIHFASRIVRGYTSFLKSVFRVIAFSIAIASLATVITLPLWYWATTHRSSFTVAVLIILGSAVAFLCVKQLRNNIISLKNKGYTNGSIIAAPLFLIGKILAALLLVYITLLVFTSISLIAGLLSAVLALVLIGIMFFTSR